MSFSLTELFEQAKEDGHSVNVNALHFEARLLYGVKIVHEVGRRRVTILNTQKGGDHYREVTLKDYESFQDFGWRHGVYLLAIANSSLRVSRMEDMVAQEKLREPRRDSYLKINKAQLKKVYARQAMLIKKFNNLNSNRYDTSKK